MTPLHWAAHNGHTAITELLLSNGADLNAVARVSECEWGVASDIILTRRVFPALATLINIKKHTKEFLELVVSVE